jgi:Ner family transcriptional regulator
VPEHATTNWDRHAILAEIKRRHGTLKAFAALTTVSASEISAALGSPYPKAEAAIADALGVPVQRLWPDRYWPNGRRREFPYRRQGSGASQKLGAASDREPAQ